jgi:hypothetical protein
MNYELLFWDDDVRRLSEIKACYGIDVREVRRTSLWITPGETGGRTKNPPLSAPKELNPLRGSSRGYSATEGFTHGYPYITPSGVAALRAVTHPFFN